MGLFREHDHDCWNGGQSGDTVNVKVEEVSVDGEFGHDEDFGAGEGSVDAVVCLALLLNALAGSVCTWTAAIRIFGRK